MLEVLYFIFQFIGVILVTILASIAATITIFALLAWSIISYAVIPACMAVIHFIAAHIIALSAIAITIFSLAVIFDPVFRKDMMQLDYRIIFGVFSTATAIVNMVVVGHLLTNTLIANLSLTAIAIVYPFVTRLYDPMANKLIHTKVISRFKSLFISDDVLELTKKPHIFTYLKNQKCNISHLQTLLQKDECSNMRIYSPSYNIAKDTSLLLGTDSQKNDITQPYDQSSIIPFLSNQNIYSLIEDRHIDFHTICANWPNKNLSFLTHDNIASLLKLGALTVETCLHLEHQQFENLSLDVFSSGFEQYGLNLEQCKNIHYNVHSTLKNTQIATLVKSGYLTIEDVTSATINQMESLKNPKLNRWINPQDLTAKDVINFTQLSAKLFRHQRTPDVLKALSLSAKDALASNDLQQQKLYDIAKSEIALADIPFAFALPEHQWQALKLYDQTTLNPPTQLHRDLFSQLTLAQCQNLNNQRIQNLVRDGKLTFEQARDLSEAQLHNLLNLTVRQRTIYQNQYGVETGVEHTDIYIIDNLLRAGVLSLNDINQLFTPMQIIRLVALLHDTELQNQIIEGRMNFADFIDTLGMANQEFLRRHNTHTASVHESVSQSAIKLNRLYGAKYQRPHKITEQLDRLYTTIQRGNHPHKHPAMHALQRLQQPLHQHIDPVSNVSTTKLIAMSVDAISDTIRSNTSFDDGIKMLTDGLYEIQRGNNFDDHGYDNRREDDPICPPGAFNKMMEKLCSTHPDVEINFITKQGASNKLPIIVKEEVKSFLQSKLNNLPIAAWNRLLQALSQDGVETIYDNIKDNIKHRIKDEFGSLFPSDKNLDEFVSHGAYADVNDIVMQFNHPQGNITNALAAHGLFPNTDRPAMPTEAHSTPNAAGFGLN